MDRKDEDEAQRRDSLKNPDLERRENRIYNP
jgi:hypothetical protein